MMNISNAHVPRFQLQNLCLKRTFIDFESEGRLSPRPASDPGTSSTVESFHFFAAEANYVRELSTLMDGDASLRAKSCEDADASARERPTEIPSYGRELRSFSPMAPLMSAGAADNGSSSGSSGHPELCARPCVLAAAGRCERGLSCTYCHMAHETSRVRFDKRRRDAFQRMAPDERIAAILPIVRVKVIELQLDQNLLQDITDILSALQPIICTAAAVKNIRNLQRTQWTKLSLRALFAMMRRAGLEAGPLEVNVSVERLCSKIQAEVLRTSCSVD
eukprot:TRINITY_DN21411_c0_g1_i2.p1 TRINITY_DN21411_c0_g1~~TRINITY_DN21411_c0_g1_i2.p1  ORF type:complete len:277 (-),score=35.44 TRINITY_DN21411_c0_g1_i2:445-1275(-)